MPHPTKRHTKTSRRTRAAHFGLKKKPLLSCPKCKSAMLSHRACPECGFVISRSKK